MVSTYKNCTLTFVSTAGGCFDQLKVSPSVRYYTYRSRTDRPPVSTRKNRGSRRPWGPPRDFFGPPKTRFGHGRSTTVSFVGLLSTNDTVVIKSLKQGSIVTHWRNMLPFGPLLHQLEAGHRSPSSATMTKKNDRTGPKIPNSSGNSYSIH